MHDQKGHFPVTQDRRARRPSLKLHVAWAQGLKKQRRISCLFPLRTLLHKKLPFKALCWLTLLNLLPLWALAAEVRIVEVRPGFPLNNQHFPPTDYYLNAGSKNGIKVGQKLSLYRYTSVTDPKNQQERIQMKTPVGEVEVIFVDDHLSVARAKTIKSDTQSPRLELPSIALGDWAEGF